MPSDAPDTVVSQPWPGASGVALPPPRPYRPVTFLERGVAVPFTTPLLGGVRVRPSEASGVELVIPNPAGGKGVYIMPWATVSELTRPTLHDRVLYDRLKPLPAITPTAIRHVSRAVALEGLAGEAAQRAASQAQEAERSDLVVTNYRLLMLLVEQTRLQSASPPGITSRDMSVRAQMTVEWVARQLRQAPTWTALALEALADILADIGVEKRSAPCRIPRVLHNVQAVRDGILAWAEEQDEAELQFYAKMIADSAGLSISLARTMLDHSYAQTQDMMTLLGEWAADPQAVGVQLSRPNWLLDGWEPICLVWNQALEPAARRSALLEVASMVPILPREANDWYQGEAPQMEIARFRKFIRLNQDWLSGVMLQDLIARNERFRALAA